MSFWDHIKPATRVPQAAHVALESGGAVVRVEWDDGHKTQVSARKLRQSCPCAECVEEWSGRRTFEVETIPEGMKILEASPVGNYALQFTFSDAHRTGIYNWGHLRELSAA
ncbi:MAG: DUF971 domain-containing protein [Myxococcaceae bacterium]